MKKLTFICLCAFGTMLFAPACTSKEERKQKKIERKMEKIIDNSKDLIDEIRK